MKVRAADAMKRAHEMRREAARKIGCRTSEIIFSLCLKDAWAEQKELREKYEANRSRVLADMKKDYLEAMKWDKAHARKIEKLALEWKAVREGGIIRKEYLADYIFII